MRACKARITGELPTAYTKKAASGAVFRQNVDNHVGRLLVFLLCRIGFCLCNTRFSESKFFALCTCLRTFFASNNINNLLPTVFTTLWARSVAYVGGTTFTLCNSRVRQSVVTPSIIAMCPSGTHSNYHRPRVYLISSAFATPPNPHKMTPPASGGVGAKALVARATAHRIPLCKGCDEVLVCESTSVDLRTVAPVRDPAAGTSRRWCRWGARPFKRKNHCISACDTHRRSVLIGRHEYSSVYTGTCEK